MPTLIGVVCVIAEALGGDGAWSFVGFSAAFAMPGFVKSAALSLGTGLVSTFLSLVVTIAFFAAFSGSRWLQTVSVAIRPILALPHAAAAFGLMVLVMPSGWLVRLIAPLVGLDRPPDLLLVGDPLGLALIAGMTIKEIPFLIFVGLSVLPQTDPRRVNVAVSMGYSRMWGWLVASFPYVYSCLRYPVLAVLAFATASVDMAIILGPSTPPTLAVQILRWLGDPDLAMRPVANAAALLQLTITGLAIGLWIIGEQVVARLGKRILSSGVRLPRLNRARPIIAAVMGWTILSVFLGLMLIVIHSVSSTWRFPDPWPTRIDWKNWAREWPDLWPVAINSLVLSIVTAGLGLALTVACLENEYRRQRPISNWGWMMIYLPLILPQIVLVPGLGQFLLRVGLDANLFAVAFVHLLYVFPYSYITLSGAWSEFDNRYLHLALASGKSPDKVLLTVRLPMLLPSLLVAFALGFSVSIAQYLPTLLVGAGRTPTLTTEAVALASGGNRRLIGIYAVAQALLPFAAFAVAAAVPALLYRNRRAMRPDEQMLLGAT